MGANSVTLYTNDGINVTGWNNSLAWTFTGLGTVSNNSVWTRRVGDTMFVRGSVTTGTVTGVTVTINLPSGSTIDTTKLSAAASGIGVGLLYNTQNGTTLFTDATFAVFFLSANNTLFVSRTSGTSNVHNKAIGTDFNSSGNLDFSFDIPITQFS